MTEMPIKEAGGYHELPDIPVCPEWAEFCVEEARQ